MLDRQRQKISNYTVQHDARGHALDMLIASVADFFVFPIALVTLVGDEHWLIAKAGIDVDAIAMENAFCKHVVNQKGLLIVDDASVHPDFQHNPLVTGEPGIRFYARVPLMAGGKEVGAVCLIDSKPNILSTKDLRFLETLSYFISDYIYLIDKHVNTRVDWFYKQLGADVGVDTWEWIISTGEIQFGPTWFYLLGIEPVDNKITLSYWMSRVHADDYECLKKSVIEHLEGRAVAINNEFRARHINGSWIWFEIYGKAFEYDESGAPLRVAGTSKNITVKKNGELSERKQICLLNFIIRAQAVF
ncbi:PAS domain-containing protein [Halomonas sp. HAL1]|uniref:PAS domain-containing protein n=1 Tax=Halomonas sp. HAL1 TaxID=550984 RepID=UPI00022D34AB|nr:PAS domain-containing protein [Halomonas sp. HAL1]EHA16763.1 two-component hybrid sensor and regulator [Halomonas sp. HAL1]WKV94748.1 PAS domain-containing protein [Halomonas sp. HAL1]